MQTRSLWEEGVTVKKGVQRNRPKLVVCVEGSHCLPGGHPGSDLLLSIRAQVSPNKSLY